MSISMVPCSYRARLDELPDLDGKTSLTRSHRRHRSPPAGGASASISHVPHILVASSPGRLWNLSHPAVAFVAAGASATTYPQCKNACRHAPRPVDDVSANSDRHRRSRHARRNVRAHRRIADFCRRPRCSRDVRRRRNAKDQAPLPARTDLRDVPYHRRSRLIAAFCAASAPLSWG